MTTEFANKAKEKKITWAGRLKICLEKLRNSKKRIGIKVFHESKGATDYTELITTNTLY